MRGQTVDVLPSACRAALWHTGRSVLITGASGGIGAATARAFAEAEDRVALHFGSSLTRAQEVLSSLPGRGHIIARADLTDPHAIQSMVEEMAGRLGSIDVVVNNAALYSATTSSRRHTTSGRTLERGPYK